MREGAVRVGELFWVLGKRQEVRVVRLDIFDKKSEKKGEMEL